MSDYSDNEKLLEVERELQMRKRFYPAMIARGTLSFERAQRYCDILRAVAQDYRTKEDLLDDQQKAV